MSKATQSSFRRRRFTRISMDMPRRTILSAAVQFIVTLPVFANPQGGNVVAGVATIGTSGPVLTVNQASNRAIVNWSSFSINPGETTRFVQPSAASAILNRVTGADPSTLMGRLSSNGQVYLINQNGIVVGPNGKIDTGGFIASTLNVQDGAFMQGVALAFKGNSNASITNLGTIQASTGDVALIAVKIDNAGNVMAPNGRAVLASGTEVFYVPEGSEDVIIKTASPVADTGVDNAGLISAASIQLKAAGSPYALAVNNGGHISATSVKNKGGRVVLDGGDGDVVMSGTITARSNDEGGNVLLTGERVALTGDAVIDVSAPAGGGKVAVGGGAQGADPGIRNAAMTSVGPHAVILANATDKGDGGSLTVWADKTTNFAGRMEAKGGPHGGAGGHAEVSGRFLHFSGNADLTAPWGKTGTLLLDPDAIEVVAGAAAAPNNANDGIWTIAEDAGAQIISTGAISTLLVTSHLDLQANTSITVNAPINANDTNVLTLTAPNVAINQSINRPNGDLQFFGALTLPIGQTLTSAGSATITARQLTISSYDVVNLAGPVIADTVSSPGGGTSFAIVNAANAINTLVMGPPDIPFSGNVNVFSSGAMTVRGEINTTGGTINLTAGGNFVLSPANVLLTKFTTNGGQITLGSSGGEFVNQVGSSVIGGTGRRVIYSATDSGSFSDGSLGYPRVQAAFGADPQAGMQQIIYINTFSSLPLLTITAVDVSRLYGQANSFSATYSGGSASNLTSPVQFMINGSPNNVASDVGVYTLTPYGAASTTHSISYVNGTLTVNPASLFITASNASRLYGSPNPAFSATFSGLTNGDTSSVVSGLKFTTSATSGSNVGQYSIVPTGASASNYAISYANGVLTVNPAILLISANDASRLYGGPNPAFSATFFGLSNGDTSNVVSGLKFTTTATSGSNVGQYSIVPTGASASNYVISYANGVLKVNPAPLTITANNASRKYGAADPPFSATFSGLLNGDSSAVVSGLKFKTSAVSASGVGDYTIEPFGASATNYAISYANGVLKIDPALLVITPVPTIATYGTLPAAADLQIPVEYNGLVNDDTPQSVLTNFPTVVTDANTRSPVGKYKTLPIGAASIKNYEIHSEAGTLLITPARVTVTAHDIAVTKGAAMPTLTGDAQGLASGETIAQNFVFTVPITSTEIQSDSTEKFNIGLQQLNSNYTVTFKPGKLTVLHPPITSGAFWNQITVSVNFDLQAKTDISSVEADKSKNSSDFTIYESDKNVIDFSALVLPMLGFREPGARAEFLAVIEQFIKGTPMSRSDFLGRLFNPETRMEAMGALLPLLTQNFQNILDLPEEQWSWQQRKFVEAVRDYIQAQRKAAAKKATHAYKAWYDEQVRIRAEKLNEMANDAVAVQRMSLMSSEPPVPPNDFLLEAKGGVAMDMGQIADYIELNANIAEQGKKLLDAQIKQAAAEVEWMLGEVSKNVLTEEQKEVVRKLKSELDKVGEDFSKAVGFLEDIEKFFQNASKQYEELGYGEVILPSLAAADSIISEVQSTSVIAGDISKASEILGGKLGASLSSAEIVSRFQFLKKTKVYEKAWKSMDRIVKMIDKATAKEIKDLTKAIGAGVLDDVARLSKETAQKGTKLLGTVKDVSKGLKIFRVANKVLGPIGLVLDLAGNILQAGLAIGQYSAIAQYNADFIKAVDNAQKSVSVNELRDMVKNDTLSSYMGMMLASGGKPPEVPETYVNLKSFETF